MAKKKSGKKAEPGKKTKKEQNSKHPSSGYVGDKESSILDAVEAMSSSDEEPIDRKSKASNAKAEALRKMIKDGCFNTILDKDNNEEDDESIEELVLDDDDDRNDDEQSENHDAGGTTMAKANDGDTNQQMDDDEDEGSQHHASNNSEEKEDDFSTEQGVFDMNSKALLAKTAQLEAEKKHFSWAERFDVIPSEPLPFGSTDEETGKKVDVHDDLKREVAFYDIALEAVQLARAECKKAGIPFARPDDFFAEMVKSDDHMARVKDRLIFENKKIEAVAQRKSSKEQKLRAKEAHSNKVAEKSKRKKENMNFVDDWAKTAASNRGGKYSDQDDQKFLRKMSSSQDKGPNKKRLAADNKYGFGGKRGRFKQNDPKMINDMSNFNPKGNFGAGSKRQGKRARDAGRKRQRKS